jgi:hypothetical protein
MARKKGRRDQACPSLEDRMVAVLSQNVLWGGFIGAFKDGVVLNRASLVRRGIVPTQKVPLK